MSSAMSGPSDPPAGDAVDPPSQGETTPRPVKAEGAYRTISEVAEGLDVPQHVLRFWETKFTQVKPLKRAGGRRYYRPDDILLLQGIRHLLYGEGYTLRGVQRILREKGVREVKAIGARLDGLPGAGVPGDAGAGDRQAVVAETIAPGSTEPETAPDDAGPPEERSSGQRTPRQDSSRQDNPKQDNPKQDNPGRGAPRQDSPSMVADTGRVEAARAKLAEALTALDRAEAVLKARLSISQDD